MSDPENLEPVDTPEAEDNKPDLDVGVVVRSKLDVIASDEAMDSEAEGLKQGVASNPDFAEILKIRADIAQLAADYELENDSGKRYGLHNQRGALLKAMYSKSNYRNYVAAENMISCLKDRRISFLRPDSEDAKLLLAAISDIGQHNQTDEPAPFANYKQNTDESWQYVPDQVVRGFLDKRPFFDTDDMELSGNRVRINHEPDSDPFFVDSSIFVCASGFESWRGRGDGIDGKKEWSSKYGEGGPDSTSLDTIKHYASLTTDLPPVDKVNIYVQPNGRMFANNDIEDSHRIAAAFLRGDKTIKANNIEFIKLDKNIIDGQPDLSVA